MGQEEGLRRMAGKYKEIGIDHNGEQLLDDISASARVSDEMIVGYRVRWWETDDHGIRRHPSRSFSGRDLPSLDLALSAAVDYQEEVNEALEVDGAVTRPNKDGSLTPNDLLKEWIQNHGPEISEDYATGVVKRWGKEVEHRPIGRARLERISADPSLIVRFQDELIAAGMTAAKRYEILKDFRAVMRWGRKRHPSALTVELNGIIDLPKLKRTRLPYAADAVGMERAIEAIEKRPARDDLLPLRDAAFAACLGFTRCLATVRMAKVGHAR